MTFRYDSCRQIFYLLSEKKLSHKVPENNRLLKLTYFSYFTIATNRLLGIDY
jgi:hypothetical protein